MVDVGFTFYSFRLLNNVIGDFIDKIIKTEEKPRAQRGAFKIGDE